MYFEPINNKFFAFAARIDFVESLPRTKQSASEMLDFPEPFGPIKILIPLSNITSVFWAKDLKPCITNLLM